MNVSEDLRRPVTLALIGFAVIGWALFVWSWTSAGSERDELQASLASLNEKNQVLDTDLRAQQAAAGTVTDLDKRQHDAEALLATARASTAEFDKTRQAMEAQRDAARTALAQAVKERAVAEQAVAESNMERDRVDAESGASRQGVEALRQQISQFDDQLTKRKAEQATLDKQTSDLRDALAGLTEERDAATKALADTTANVERESVEAAAAQKDIDEAKQTAVTLEAQIAAKTAAAQEAADTAKQNIAALRQQIAESTAAARTEADAAQQKLATLDQQIADRAAAAQKEANAAQQTATALKQQIADETAQLAGLQRDAAQLRAETAQKSAIETQLTAARDALNAASRQRSDVERAIADGSVLRDRIATEVTEARTALAETKSALTDLRAQLKIESDVANAPRPVAPAPPGTDAGQPAAP